MPMAGTISSTDWQSWISSPAPHRRPRLRLFCFPYAGGGTSFYRAWVSALPPGVELCRVHLPGRENRLTEPAFDRLPPLVERLVRVLPSQCARPRCVLRPQHGRAHCVRSGPRTSTTRQGRARPPVLSGHRAAQIPDPDPPIHHLPDAQFLRRAAAPGRHARESCATRS